MKSVSIEVRTPTDMLPMLTEYELHMDAVQRRAYHLFEERGAFHGQALDDWLEAQAQTLFLPQVQTSEEEPHYVVLTALTGFTADRVRVIVSPNDMVLRAESGVKPGKRRAAPSLKAMTYYRFSQQIDPGGVQAYLSQGVLRIVLPKIATAAL